MRMRMEIKARSLSNESEGEKKFRNHPHALSKVELTLRCNNSLDQQQKRRRKGTDDVAKSLKRIEVKAKRG